MFKDGFLACNRIFNFKRFLAILDAIFSVESQIENKGSFVNFGHTLLQICLFAEHLANLLLLRYNNKWDEKCESLFVMNDFYYLDAILVKELRVLYFVQNYGLSEEIANAALAVGLGVDEVVFCLPGQYLRFFKLLNSISI